MALPSCHPACHLDSLYLPPQQSELGLGSGCEALRGKELSDAAHAASTTALQRLEKEVWAQVKQARKAVSAVTVTVSRHGLQLAGDTLGPRDR